MNEKIRTLMEKRAEALTQARALLDKADGEGRSLNAEEQQTYDRYDAELDQIEADIKREERLCARETEAARSLNGSRNPVTQRPIGEGGEERGEATDRREYRDGLVRYMAAGIVDPCMQRDAYGQREYRDNIGGVNLSDSSGAAGGLLAPAQLEKHLLEAVRENSVMRRLCTVRTSASDVDIPYVSQHVTASFVAEGGAFTASDPAFAKISFKAYKAAALTKVTFEAMQDVFVDVSAWIRDEYAHAFADLEESKFINGTGSAQPTGILAATGGAASGLTAASATAITADELFDLVHSVASKYRQHKTCTFLMNDSTLKLIRKLKTTSNDYLLQPGLRLGEPDTLLGYKVETSSQMPAAAASAKAIAFGDFKAYYILDRRGLYIQRLNELYAGNGQVGFLAYRRFDGKLTDTSAIKVLTMKAGS